MKRWTIMCVAALAVGCGGDGTTPGGGGGLAQGGEAGVGGMGTGGTDTGGQGGAGGIGGMPPLAHPTSANELNSANGRVTGGDYGLSFQMGRPVEQRTMTGGPYQLDCAAPTKNSLNN